MNKDNVFVIGDTHIPFEHPRYLNFCLRMRDRYKCNTVIHIGDLTDNHAISYHEHDPDGLSPGAEYKVALKRCKKWYKAFPKVKLCRGNHDRLIDRKQKTVGLPKVFFKGYRDIWELPNGWEDQWEYTINNVRYEHGTNYSGKYPHMTAAINNRCRTVIGHCHSVAGVEWLANSDDCIFGMSVGSGIRRHTYVFAYGVDFRRKPIVGCGVVTDNGRYAQWLPCDL